MSNDVLHCAGGHVLSKSVLIDAIKATDEWVKAGKPFNYMDPAYCPGAIYTGQGCYSTDIGSLISNFVGTAFPHINKPAGDPVWQDWPYLRSLVVSYYNLDIGEMNAVSTR